MVAFLLPLWYNGAPLYYPDSMGYLFWGMQLKVPPERAAVYGLFIRFFSLGKSLWLPVLAQSFLIAFALRFLWKKILKVSSFFYLLAGCIFLGIFSSLGWTAAMLMPDLFCAISSLVIGFLLLFPHRMTLPESLIFILIFFFASIQHVSIFLINLLILGAFGVYFLFTKRLKSKWFRISRLVSMVLIGYVAIGFIHKSLEGKFFISKSSNAFLLGRLAETGILANYLDEHCPNQPLKLCDIRPTLPMRSEYFLWNESSFIHQKGGLHDTQGAYGEVISGVFSSPKYVVQFALAGLEATAQQLFMIKVGDGLEAGEKPQLMFFQRDEKNYIHSRQNQTIDFDPFNGLIYAGLGILTALFLITRSYQKLSPELKMFGIFLLFLFLANAAVNGALSTPLHRYQTRVFWLADVWLLAALYPAFRQRFSSESKVPQ